MRDKKKLIIMLLRDYRSGNKNIDEAVDKLFHGFDEKTRRKAHRRLVKIGEPAVLPILKGLWKNNTFSGLFDLWPGYKEENTLAIMTLKDIGSPLAFPVLREIYKVVRKDGRHDALNIDLRRLYANLLHALWECDHRRWVRLWRKLVNKRKWKYKYIISKNQ